MREPLPLATIHSAVLEFLKDMDDSALFGAQAVNAYVDESRMTQDVDILSVRGEELAEELRQFLNKRFHIAVRIREIGDGRGYRLYQVQKPKNRHLVDVRPVPSLPPTKRVQRILVLSPEELIASKVIAYHERKGQPKSGTDWRDIAMLLLRFPKLKDEAGLVRERLLATGADASVLATWKQIVHEKIAAQRDEDEFG